MIRSHQAKLASDLALQGLPKRSWIADLIDASPYVVMALVCFWLACGRS